MRSSSPNSSPPSRSNSLSTVVMSSEYSGGKFARICAIMSSSVNALSAFTPRIRRRKCSSSRTQISGSLSTSSSLHSANSFFNDTNDILVVGSYLRQRFCQARRAFPLGNPSVTDPSTRPRAAPSHASAKAEYAITLALLASSSSSPPTSSASTSSSSSGATSVPKSTPR